MTMDGRSFVNPERVSPCYAPSWAVERWLRSSDDADAPVLHDRYVLALPGSMLRTLTGRFERYLREEVLGGALSPE